MGHICVILFLLFSAIISLFRPWIGVLVAYFIVILSPQTVWFWNFQGIRPFYYVAVPTILGFLFLFFKNELNCSLLRTKINILLLVTWLFIIFSYFWGPYVDCPHALFNPQIIFEQVNKTFFFYFLATVLIDTPKKLKYLASIIIVSTLYMIYWANCQYLSHSYIGRLHGPTSLEGGIYSDENAFAMLFVTGLPFIYYLGYFLKNRILRFSLWMTIPFGWHAIFLTGSRGGLLGLIVTILLASLRSPRKWIGFLLLPALIIAYMWQGGSVMKERAKTIKSYKEEYSAQTRLQAWNAAIKMILSYPITGVGISSFIEAFPDFSDKQPRAAHNTFFQLAAESGILAGLSLFLAIFLILKETFKNPWKNNFHAQDNYVLFLLNEALFVSLSGFLVCALFLSLEKYEILFYLILLANNLLYFSAGIHNQKG